MFFFISVQSCGWLSPPYHGQKEGTLYLEGATVTFSCHDGYRLYGSQERTCDGDGKWSGQETSCVAGGLRKVLHLNKIKYESFQQILKCCHTFNTFNVLYDITACGRGFISSGPIVFKAISSRSEMILYKPPLGGSVCPFKIYIFVWSFFKGH